jgi:hypothetical protein
LNHEGENWIVDLIRETRMGADDLEKVCVPLLVADTLLSTERYREPPSPSPYIPLRHRKNTRAGVPRTGYGAAIARPPPGSRWRALKSVAVVDEVQLFG